jgi:hypothetical protein
LPVQEVGRRRLETAAQRDQDTTGNVSQGETTLGGLGAVYNDIKGGVIEGLLDAEVGEARHLVQLGQDLVCDLAVPFKVRALDLYVNRGWQAEVQNLRDHIRGYERQGNTGECPWQALP